MNSWWSNTTCIVHVHCLIYQPCHSLQEALRGLLPLMDHCILRNLQSRPLLCMLARIQLRQLKLKLVIFTNDDGDQHYWYDLAPCIQCLVDGLSYLLLNFPPHKFLSLHGIIHSLLYTRCLFQKHKRSLDTSSHLRNRSYQHHSLKVIIQRILVN